ncbi:MAG: hypothetical protein FWD82_01320 [Defluviitaleaceae bacterium]|nr:hypothetical protein [Defluviitaleaceae bacterium]
MKNTKIIATHNFLYDKNERKACVKKILMRYIIRDIVGDTAYYNHWYKKLQ